METSIEPYVTNNLATLFSLWQRTIGQEWPLTGNRFEQILLGTNSQLFVARKDEHIVGFVVTRKDEASNGYISALLVALEWQRQGIGTLLHQAALQYLREQGVKRVQLGGGSPRFFPGVPENLPSGLAFFQSQGWSIDHITYDLVQDLRTYTTPSYVWERMKNVAVHFVIATQDDVAELLSFEAREFPEWLTAFQHVASLGDYADLLIGRNESGQVVASLILYGPQSHPDRADALWQLLLGENVGAIGCVGVAESRQGQGIGIALVARATELLIERSIEVCSIDWVVLTEFYAKLGYHIWRGYTMCWRSLSIRK